METFPLRLICVEATLASEGGICFSPCTEWKFHIISHTWTKDVRDWSLEIFNMMPSTARDPVHKKMGPPMVDTYADLFKQHSFAQKPGHRELVEFLRILAADGVKKVWFDAICINQGDAKEKNREIENMGAYYARSEGCYAWCHGIGGGFQLWANAPSPEFYKLPRWFSRVWTLQEFVLPKKLAFVVGMDKEGFTGYFSYMAFCRISGLTWCPRELMSDGVKAKFGPRYELSLHLLNSRKHFPCPHCNHVRGSDLADNSVHVYYVDRLSYLDLMEKSSYKSIANLRLPATFLPHFNIALQRLPSMLNWLHGPQDHAFDIPCQHKINEAMDMQKSINRLHEVNAINTNHEQCTYTEIQACSDVEITKHDNVNGDKKDCYLKKCKRLQLANLAIREISLRNCSEGHDEDRLLSILALLEIEGKVQVRTGKSLEEQTLDVVTDLLNKHMTTPEEFTPSEEHQNHQEILALLCLAQFRGNPTISMSWAPTFSYQKVLGDMNFQKISAYMFHSFKTIAQIYKVSRWGLKLQCPFLRAKVSPFVHHQQKCGTCEICIEDTQMSLDQMKYFVLDVGERQHYSKCMWVHHDDVDHENVIEIRFTTACPPTCTMAIKAETSIRRLLSMSLDVWLLLLAQDKLQGCSDSYGLFLVCVGQDTANLHKVGVFFDGPGWDPEKDEESFSDAASLPLSVSSEQGGEGEDLVENEELNIADYSHQKEFEAWKEKEKYMQEFLESSPDIDEEEEQAEGDTEEESIEEEIIALPTQEQVLLGMSRYEEDEEMKDLRTWEQDSESMQRGHFTVSGFGPCVPLPLFTFRDDSD